MSFAAGISLGIHESHDAPVDSSTRSKCSNRCDLYLMLGPAKLLWGILPSSHRKRSIALVAMMTVAAVLEMVGIGALLPIIGLIQRPELMESHGILSSLSLRMGSPSQRVFLIYLLLCLLAFFIFKNVFLFFFSRFQSRLVSSVHVMLSTKLLSSYLYRPYTFHLQVNTANLIRDVTIDVGNVLNQIMIPMVVWISECLVAAALFALIVSIDPVAALFSFGFGGAVLFLFFRVMRERLSRIGAQIQDDFGMMIQYAQEGLGGIKEIKILGRERFFLNAYSKHLLRYTSSIRDAMDFNAMPRLVLDMLVIILFIGVLLILMTLGRSDDALPLMTIYAASAFRLLPGMNRIMASMNALRLGGASLARVVASLGEDHKYPRTRHDQEATPRLRDCIQVDNVRFRYQDRAASAIAGISLQINRGEMVGFMGITGSGKTTLIDIILGLFEPVSGRVLVDGNDIHLNLGGWQRQIGYIPQSIYLTDDTLRRNVAFGVPDEDIDDERVWRALDAAQLADFVRSLPGGMETVIGERGARLSGGQRQRVGMARAMYYDPEVLVLDEATSALDGETEKKMMQAISALHRLKTILIIAHRPSTLEFCDRVFVINHGRLERVSVHTPARSAVQE